MEYMYMYNVSHDSLWSLISMDEIHCSDRAGLILCFVIFCCLYSTSSLANVRLWNKNNVKGELINMIRAWDKYDLSSTDSSSMQDSDHLWIQLNDLGLHEFCRSVDKASIQCSGGHGFDSCPALRIFLCHLLCHVDTCTGKFTLHILLPSLKLTIFIQNDFSSADSSSM